MQQKIYISALYILFLMFFSSYNTQAQCKTFVRSCVPQLHPYIHDGSYQAVIMGEGEEAEVIRTVFAGQQYRLFICVDNALPNVEFIVSDNRRNILFDNRKNDNVNIWNFKPATTQLIKITIRIPKKGGNAEQTFGCVSVLFGILDQ